MRKRDTEKEHPSSPTFSIFVSVLEGLHQSQSLVHRASHRQVIDGDLPQDAFIVNHKQTSVEQDKRRKQTCLQ